jgi:hypothetical protein
MPSAPALSPEQRAAALSKAAAARSRRAEVRVELKAGRLSLAELFERAGSEDHLATMRITALLDALPGYGKVRSASLLDELGIASSRRLRGIGAHQRAALLARIDGPAQSRS